MRSSCSMDGYTTPPMTPINQPNPLAQAPLAPVIHYPVAAPVNAQQMAFVDHVFNLLSRPLGHFEAGPGSVLPRQPNGPASEEYLEMLDR